MGFLSNKLIITTPLTKGVSRDQCERIWVIWNLHLNHYVSACCCWRKSVAESDFVAGTDFVSEVVDVDVACAINTSSNMTCKKFLLQRRTLTSLV